MQRFIFNQEKKNQGCAGKCLRAFSKGIKETNKPRFVAFAIAMVKMPPPTSIEATDRKWTGSQNSQILKYGLSPSLVWNNANLPLKLTLLLKVQLH